MNYPIYMRISKLFFLINLTAYLSFFITSHPVFSNQDEQITNIEFIFDASNSMNEKLHDQTKLNTAKKVLKNLIEKLSLENPANLNIGLRVYGHRFDPYGTKEKACSDSELIAPIEGIHKETLFKQIDSIKATGYTPIAYSLEQTKQDFKIDSSNSNMTILISDGKETCEGDPCKIAEELKNSGIDTTIHVIGFDVDEETKKLLSCISESSGGIFVSAANMEELEEALHKTVEVSREIIEKPHQGTITFTIIGMDQIDPDTQGKIFNENAELIDTLIINQTKDIDPGTYRIVVETDYETLEKDKIVVEKRKDKVVALRPKKGALSLSIYEDGDDISDRVTVLIYPTGSEEEIETAIPRSPKTFYLDPGEYDILANYPNSKTKPDLWAKNIKIEKGSKIQKDINYSLGILWIKTYLNQNPTREFSIKIFKSGASESKEKQLDRFHEKTKVWTDELRQPLDEGKYEIFAQHLRSKNMPGQWIKNISVEFGQIVEKEIHFDGVALKCIASMNGVENRDYSFTIYPVGSKEKRFEERKSIDQNIWTNLHEFILSPGLYDIEVKHLKSTQVEPIWIENIDLKKGDQISKTFEFSSGSIKATALINNQKAGGEFIFRLYPENSSKLAQDQLPKPIHENHYTNNYVIAIKEGVYDLKVDHPLSANSPSQWFSDIQIMSNQRSNFSADFIMGSLKVDVQIDDETKQQYKFTTYPAGSSSRDPDELRNIHVHADHYVKEYKVRLYPGYYDIFIENSLSKDYTSKWIQNIEIKPSEINKQKVTLELHREN